MIYLERLEEPLFWNSFCEKHPGITYSELQNTEEGIKIRNELRRYNIEQQHGLCAYCCRNIDLSNSLNEHIKPKGLAAYSNLSMEYSNIVASCKTEGTDLTCSAAKENKYNNCFVSPLDENCESHFYYFPNGEVNSYTNEGIYTISILNLNSYRLRQARKAQLKVCDSYNLKLPISKMSFAP